jgi:sugar O-acyltransferase (sialic acid O-acetyltransferase NeuD family)
MSTLLILGAGGHGRVVADAATSSGDWTRVIASDRDPARCRGDLIGGVPALPLEQALALAAFIHIAIGRADGRAREASSVVAIPMATILHPNASVSMHAAVGEGCFIAAQAVVAPGARLGRCVIVNHGAVVDHDVSVGDFSHIAPLVALGGGVQVGCRVLIGSGASVLPGLRVGDDIVVGAGALVCRNLSEPGVYAGVPARRLK